MNDMTSANNSAKNPVDDSFRSQLSGSVFNMSQLDIPSYYQENTSVGNSAHTTPLNYMRRTTPVAATQNARKIEQIRERDTYSGLEGEQDRDIDVKFDMLKLSSNVTDDFFQLQSKNDTELEALEPAEKDYNRQGTSSELFQPSNNNDLSRRFEQRSDDPSGAADQYFKGSGYENYEPAYGQDGIGHFQQDSLSPTHRGGELSLSQANQQQGAGQSSGYTGNYLVVPPSSNGYDSMLDPAGGPLGYGQPSMRPPAYGNQQRAGWNPEPGNRGMATPSMLPPRRVGPATPSLLSSYATASAQPQMPNKYAPQPGIGGMGPQGSLGSYADYRPPQRDEMPRYAPNDRPMYPAPVAPRPAGYGMPPSSQNYYGAPAQSYMPSQRPAPYQQQQGGMQGSMPGMGGYYGNSPAAALPPVQPDFIFQVQFKRITKCFTNRSGYQIGERDFVVVEGDRGEDIGIVIAVLSMQEFVHRRMSDPRAAADNHTVDCILRLATMQERQQLPDKYNAEKNIVQSCNELAMHGFGLPIMVYDAEFQFDRNKLTIYYECNVRIDFRDFVRQLYSTYKARIWMKIGNMNTPIDAQPLAVMALATGVHFSSGGQMA